MGAIGTKNKTMSCETVQKFLLWENKKEEILKAQFKYEILNHYKLGKEIVYNGNGDINEYPLSRENIFGKTTRFKYICDISDEDFEKIKLIYEKEYNRMNKGAEEQLNTSANILQVLGILFMIIMSIVACQQPHFDWTIFGIGLVVFFVFLTEYAFAKVIVNISNKLNK